MRAAFCRYQLFRRHVFQFTVAARIKRRGQVVVVKLQIVGAVAIDKPGANRRRCHLSTPGLMACACFDLNMYWLPAESLKADRC